MTTRLFLWDIAHEDCIKGDKKNVAYCQIGAQMSEKILYLKERLQKQIKYSEIIIYGDENMQKFFSRLLRKSVYYKAYANPLFSEKMFLRLTQGQQNILFTSS